MLGNALKCDVCGNIEYVDNRFVVDVAMEGWIRMSVNQPARWSWSRDDMRSTFQIEADCCSVSCARSLLGEAEDAVATNE